MNGLFDSIVTNVTFVLEFLAIIVVLFVIAVCLEKIARKKNGLVNKGFDTRKVAVTGMLSAISVVLMLFEIPLPFAPSFYKLDLSELPILIGTFAYGPCAGVVMEFIKIVLKLFIKGTTTAFVGDFANFCVGCSFIIPAGAIYEFKKTKKMAIVSCIVGTLVMTIFGTAFNAVYLLPAFATLYGIPLDSLIAMGASVNPLVSEGSVLSFVVACVSPLNLIKGCCVSVFTMLIYKPLSPIIKSGHKNKEQ